MRHLLWHWRRRNGTSSELERIEMKSKYLGDGAYVRYENGELEIFTSNGMTKTNSVFLGLYEMSKLTDFISSLTKD